MKNICIATVIFNSPIGQIDNNILKMEKWIIKAKRKNAEIICFPELNITGYSTKPEIKDFAEKIPGKSTLLLIAQAKKYKIVILAGILEKNDSKKIYVSHLIIMPDGTFNIYRKLYLAPPELNVFSKGNKIPLFNYNGVKFGIQLCYDAHFPELSTHMAVHGVDVIFMPHASPRRNPDKKYNSWIRHLRARAFDNSVFIVACNQTGENGFGLSFPGLSIVIDPSGNIIESYKDNNEGLLVIELKNKILENVRIHKMKYFLPNTRPELYT